MNLEYKRMSVVIALTLILVLCFPALFPSWNVMAFAPFLVILYYQRSYTFCLWVSLGCGLLLDLLSAHSRIGLHAIDYCLTTGFLYSQRRNFFADNLSTLPLMTFFFALLATVMQAALIYFFEHKNLVSWPWLFTDLLAMPALDATYAFCCFILPALLFGKPIRRGKDYFMDAR